MPVAAERHPPARGKWVWLIAPIVAPGVLALFVVATIFQPVHCRWGNGWLGIGEQSIEGSVAEPGIHYIHATHHADALVDERQWSIGIGNFSWCIWWSRDVSR